ncbi:putative anion transporter 6, chloroplastic isoform X1 [Iris pallida]|uniref:Anion transporter 6, chloroplastic isoform X1 n=1 Tax=Iris pallida TaxID=29817 RepID=A0AAX6EJI2_IRIPA|nr:putative anion transporter 6, chloroplastic isoform X1 [Iris pallida]
MAAATTSFSLQSDRHLLLLRSRCRPSPRSSTRQALTPTRGALRIGVSSRDGRRKTGALARVRVEGSESQRLVGGEEKVGEEEEEEVKVVDHEGFTWRWPPWKDLPMRYRLIGTTSLAFVICNMDKVNLSIAIIPMSHQFGWNSATAGLVQSSFFWGYALSQLPGGWLAKLFGGSKVLEVGVLVWSLATALVPLVAGFMPGLVLSRILVGIGEGVSPSAATDLIARQDSIN